MKYAFAGDRQISYDILEFLISKGFVPSVIMVTDGQNSTHSDQLIEMSKLPNQCIFRGKKELQNENTIKFLKELELDYIIGIHYPYIISSELIKIPKIGFLNLHPAYLPYNKGWNTPSWAIIDNTIYGATLHFMSEELDEGDIVHQKMIKTESYDTANSLYQKVLKLEKEVFSEALESLISLNPSRVAQKEAGTSHKKKDLEKIREFNLDDTIIIGEFLNKLRALTTNRNDELAFYKVGDKKIGVKVNFIELD
jgi:methionyl-tRNA formyltransferase